MKKKLIIFVVIFISFIFFVAATFYPEPWGNDVDAGNNNLNNVNNITANNFIGNVTGEHLGSMDWTNLQNYPSSCPGSSAVTTLNDSVVCSDLWLDSTGGAVSGDVNLSKNLRIFDSSDLGSEIHTQANAVSDPNGNEADALTGWSITNGILASQTDNPYVGTYQMMGESNDANDHMEYSFTVANGKTYKISFAVRRGSQGTTQEVSGWEGFTTDPTINISSTSWAENTVYLIANSTSAKIKVHASVGGASGDKVHFDNFSIREVQGGDLVLYGLLTGGGTNGLRVLGNGNVGIGTTTPTNLLTIDGSGILQLKANTTGMTCNGANAGSIYYNNNLGKHFGCNVTDWQPLY